MKIGELSQRTGVSARALRYYDQCELLHPQRQPNQYRDYDESCVDRVGQIQALLDLGFTIATIGLIIPCTTSDPQKLRRCSRTRVALYDQLEAIDRKLVALIRIRTRVSDTLHATMDDAAVGGGQDLLGESAT